MSFIPLSIPNFEGNEKKYVMDAVEQGWVSTAGSYVTELEKKMAAFLHTQNVAACQSGTSALHLSLRESGVEPGDVVIVPTLTFIAAVNPVKYQFARPVFMDCDETLCMDPVKLRRFCEKECEFTDGMLTYKGSAVKAIIVVHVFGNMADMESIMDIADKYHIKVIEDATEALGTYYTEGRFAGKYAGTIGNFGAYSFNGNKIITTGGGGALTASDPDTVDHLRYLSTQAKDDAQFFLHDEVGFNYRMTNLQAALGVAQMEELPEFIRRKQRNYELYQKAFEDFEMAELMPFRDGVFSNMWFYSLKIDTSRITASMREIVKRLQEKAIQTRTVWGLIHEQKPYRNDDTYQLEKAPYYSSRILNIPCSTQITEEEIDYVANEIKQLLRELANG
ncbi:MAG: LegC family aminotransferase [Clostridia bacterium]|nr:LegC family aminotransferase [Clostridia bacterium]